MEKIVWDCASVWEEPSSRLGCLLASAKDAVEGFEREAGPGLVNGLMLVFAVLLKRAICSVQERYAEAWREVGFAQQRLLIEGPMGG